MEERKTVRIDFGEKRLAALADKYYNEGNYFSALKCAYKQYELYGGDGDVFTRFADIYEGMGLHLSAINWWYRFLDIAEEDDLPDIYEGLAVNYLNMGNETQSAYYYNKLIDADETLPEETKWEILNAFSKDKRSRFRFVYPPRLADYSKELEFGSKALKSGNCKAAIAVLDAVAKGSRDYAAAKEMQAVAYLLSGELNEAERVCKELLEDIPDDTRVLATLAAVYLEQGREAESREIALDLYRLQQDDTDDLYKVATVCCENGLHREAYEKFTLLEKKLPFDGRMLYFKAVSAYKSGLLEEAEKAFDTLCTVYPDAEVAKYYLKALRLRDENGISEADEPTYFYHLSQAEREARCRSLIHIGKCSRDEAQLFGLIALHDGYFNWCFDEMDGEDHDLQYLALVTAEHVRADGFLKEALLDAEVADVLKIETLRLLYLRNEDIEVGLTLCHIYRKVRLSRIRIGRKKRRRFLEGYATIASKFVVVNDAYGARLCEAAEKLYAALEQYERLELIEKAEDCACALYLFCGLKEFGNDIDAIAGAFDADATRVRNIIKAASGEDMQVNENEVKTDEAD
ncbi:MAG: tetratricopeptide repeat protein [Clostridia bacterium]|nr:tetratricopeptide repeat protein [Clostridia bacterium]